MLGDICYIVVAPGDGTEFCVSATTEGYFINKVSQTNGLDTTVNHKNIFGPVVKIPWAISLLSFSENEKLWLANLKFEHTI